MKKMIENAKRDSEEERTLFKRRGIVKDINLLTCWFYGVNNYPFEYFLNEMNIKKCYCLHIDEDEIAKDERVTLLSFNNSLDYYSDADIIVELDDEIIEKMKPYERTCMDLINRWRGSYTEKSSYQEIKRLYFIFLRYWNDFIVKNGINMMVVNTIPHIVEEYMPFAICKAYSIPTIVQGIIPFTKGEKTNYILRPDPYSFDNNLEDRYKKLVSLYADNDKDIDLLPSLKSYFSQYDTKNKTDKKVVFYNEKKTAFALINDYIDRASRYIKRGELKLVANKAKLLLKIKMETSLFLKKVESLEEPADYSNEFMLFCLHLQPEATTTPAGGNYADQLMAIRIVSECLPDNMLLYVKEHPAYWSQRNRIESVYESRDLNFYKSIKKMDNVRLIDHNISSEKLMEKCKAIITITGTVGFEALFKGIPVITFASTFYENHPLVYRVRIKNDCQHAIEEVLTKDHSFDARTMEVFLASIQKYVVPMGMFEKNFLDNGSPEVSDEDRLLLVKKIMEFYREYY